MFVDAYIVSGVLVVRRIEDIDCRTLRNRPIERLGYTANISMNLE